MINRYDVRTLGDLCSDTGTRISSTDLLTSPKMLTNLSEASGKLMAAIKKGGRYTQTQLDALTGDSLEYLKGLECRICFYLLWRIKPYTNREAQSRTTIYETDYRDAIRLLASGEDIFPTDEHVDAGHMEVDAMSAVEVESFGLVRDVAANRYFPCRD